MSARLLPALQTFFANRGYGQYPLPRYRTGQGGHPMPIYARVLGAIFAVFWIVVLGLFLIALLAIFGAFTFGLFTAS